jgi:hypothetical protein
MLTTDPHYRDHWGAVIVLGLAMWLLNDMVSRETGIRRFDLMFGSEEGLATLLARQSPTAAGYAWR